MCKHVDEIKIILLRAFVFFMASPVEPVLMHIGITHFNVPLSIEHRGIIFEIFFCTSNFGFFKILSGKLRRSFLWVIRSGILQGVPKERFVLS